MNRSPGHPGVYLARPVAALQRQVQLLVAVSVGEQLGDGQRGAAHELLVGGAGAVVVPHLEGDPGVGHEEPGTGARADGVPDGEGSLGDLVGGAGDAAGAVLDRQLKKVMAV